MNFFMKLWVGVLSATNRFRIPAQVLALVSMKIVWLEERVGARADAAAGLLQLKTSPCSSEKNSRAVLDLLLRARR